MGYLFQLRVIQKRMNDVKDGITFVSKEEELFKVNEPTEFPEVEEINAIIEPYQRLFGIVSKWMKTEKK